jgi:hypothetical protein
MYWQPNLPGGGSWARAGFPSTGSSGLRATRRGGGSRTPSGAATSWPTGTEPGRSTGSGGNTLTIERGLRAKFAATIPSSTSLLFGNASRGPIATIRAMLRRGELRDDGFASVDGQTVRHLVGKRPAFPGRSRPQLAVRYYVDADSYTPVAARIGRPPTARQSGSKAHTLGVYTRIRFTSFERLPLTAANARLLEIHPSGHPRHPFQGQSSGSGGGPRASACGALRAQASES